MKKLINLSLFVLVAALTCISCKSKDLPKVEERAVMVELKESLDGEYLSTNYETYKPKKIKRINRTLNQYTSAFSLDDVWYKGLINKLNEDPNVIKVTELNTTKLDKPLNSKNVQRSKAKPMIK